MSRQAEEVWKGVWKCEKCGEILNHFSHKHMWGGTPYGYCSGKLVPHDRRNPTQAAALIQAKREMNLEEIKEIYADKSGKLFEACHSGELIDMGAWLIAEVERLWEQNEKLCKDAAAVIIQELHLTDKGLNAIMETPLARVLGEFVHVILKSQDAPNFVTMNITVKAPEGPGLYYLTVGRRNGLTPSDKIGQITARAEKAEAEVERQAEEIGRLEVDRDLARYDKEKAEAEVERLTKMLTDSDKNAHDKSNVAYWSKASYEEIDKRKKAEAELDRITNDYDCASWKTENQRLTERVRELEEWQRLAITTIRCLSADAINLSSALKQFESALQHKEGEDDNRK